MNHCKLKKGRIKKGNDKNCRGYSGYFNGNYLRSTLEFVFATYLKYKNVKYGYEKNTYVINGKNYKPDFFLYNKHDILKCIVEIKDTKKKAEKYKKMFQQYFKAIGVRYLVIYNVNKIIKFYNLYDDVNKWKKKSIENGATDMSGVHNPRWNTTITEETRKKQSKKRKDYFKKNPEKRKELSEIIKKTMTVERRKQISNRQKERYKNKRIIFEKNNPKINKSCIICGKMFDTIDKNRKTCKNSGCTIKYKISIGILKPRKVKEKSKTKQYKTKLINFIKNYNLNLDDDISAQIQQLRTDKKIPYNFGISIKTIKKYFGDINNLKKEYYGKIN